jgi:hypothetical protein
MIYTKLAVLNNCSGSLWRPRTHLSSLWSEFGDSAIGIEDMEEGLSPMLTDVELWLVMQCWVPHQQRSLSNRQRVLDHVLHRRPKLCWRVGSLAFLARVPLVVELAGVVDACRVLCWGARDTKAVAQLDTTNLVLKARFEILHVGCAEWSLCEWSFLLRKLVLNNCSRRCLWIVTHSPLRIGVGHEHHCCPHLALAHHRVCVVVDGNESLVGCNIDIELWCRELFVPIVLAIGGWVDGVGIENRRRRDSRGR